MSLTSILILFLFFFILPTTTEIYSLSLHDALPIYCFAPLLPVGTPCRDATPSRCFSSCARAASARDDRRNSDLPMARSEEHTSELQSRFDLVCRLLLEKKNNLTNNSFSFIYNLLFS